MKPSKDLDEQIEQILLEAINEGWFLRSKSDYPNGFTGNDVRNIQLKAKQQLLAVIEQREREARIDELTNCCGKCGIWHDNCAIRHKSLTFKERIAELEKESTDER